MTVNHPAPRADPAAASVQRSMRRGVSTDGAQSPADTRWRRDQMHFSPDRALAGRRAPARPDWSVASDAAAGTRRAGRAVTNHLFVQVWRSVNQPTI
jgi:hypothetical protein